MLKRKRVRAWKRGGNQLAPQAVLAEDFSVLIRGRRRVRQKRMDAGVTVLH